MSFSGKKTPLQLNAEAQLTVNKGLWINPEAISYQGLWTAKSPYGTPETLSYSQGSVTGSTVLNKLTTALSNFYDYVAPSPSLTSISSLEPSLQSQVLDTALKAGPPLAAFVDITFPAVSVEEGSSITLNVATQDIPSGTTLYWRAFFYNGMTAIDINYGSGGGYGSFQTSGINGQFSILATPDTEHEPGEYFILKLYLSSGDSQTDTGSLTSSPMIYITPAPAPAPAPPPAPTPSPSPSPAPAPAPGPAPSPSPSPSSQLCVTVWRNLLSIGRPPQNSAINCPALGNSRPDAFKTSYAGYGTFKTNSTTDKFGNRLSSGTLGLVESVYPPYQYPTTGQYSYIFNNWSSMTPIPGWPTNCEQTSFSAYTDPVHYQHEYAWITGWPAVYSWQSKAAGNPQIAFDPVGDGDTYAAAYYPRPDLATIQPWRARDFGKIEYDEYFKNGFIATVARQAYYEFWSNYTTRRSNQYPEFLKSFTMHAAYASGTNKNINSFVNTKTFIKGNYSNINDLTSSDFAGVNLAFRDFGNDMIRLGKAVDLSNIHLFGLPSKFLINLQKWNALTEALRLALLFVDLSMVELDEILLPTYTPSVVQEKKIYAAMQLVGGGDLEDIKIIINCTTTGLSTLADLLDPKKMFPNSYRSLTLPQYSVDTLSSKIYDFIYLGNGVNTRIKNWGGYLADILPGDLPVACGAFMMTMNQVKNIRQMDFEKVSQVVANLEVTNKDLPLTNSTDGVPGSVALAEQELGLIGLGSGAAGTYRFCDFLGAMSGQPYVTYYQKAQELIAKLQTPTLETIYNELYELSVSGVFTNEQIQGLIDAANAEIFNIQSSYPADVAQLNYWWDKIGKQLWIEQRAIPYSVQKNEMVYGEAGREDIDAFIRNLEMYALDTAPCEVAPILEAISDLTDIGGQSIVASLREARNGDRLLNVGGEPENNVPDTHQTPVSVRATISSGGGDGGVAGTVVSISADGTCEGYPPNQPPPVVVLPQGGVFGNGTGQNAAGVAILDSAGAIAEIRVTDGGSGYDKPPTILVDCPPPPVRLGNSTVPGSFAGSPYTGQDPISDNLISPEDSSYTVDEAIDAVTQCNCDCWLE